MVTSINNNSIMLEDSKNLYIIYVIDDNWRLKKGMLQ